MRRLPAWLLLTLLVPACAEPPNKEINQAQGALDTARAAGADRYATDEYTAAGTALTQANEAVTQGDYRLALSHALDSREHAQNAARLAADNRARIRGQVERDMAEIASLIAQANARMTAATTGRVPASALSEPQALLAQVNADVQEAGAAMSEDDYLGAQPVLADVKTRIERILMLLDATSTSQPARRRR